MSRDLLGVAAARAGAAAAVWTCAAEESRWRFILLYDDGIAVIANYMLHETLFI